MKKDYNKNPFGFVELKNPNLTANGGKGYNHNDSEYGRYGYDHHADNQYVNGYDHADYQYSGKNEDNQYGGCRSDQAGNEGYGISRKISRSERHHFYGNGSYIYSKYVWGNHQNDTDRQ